MNCASACSRVRNGRPRGFTLLEMLTAVLILGLFFTGATLGFVQMLRAKDRTQARLEALGNARHALDRIGNDLHLARSGPAGPPFFGVSRFDLTNTTATLFSGNRTDDDQDTRVDEELVDGADNDGDWTTSDDLHAELTSGVVERPTLRGKPDPGDLHVDEDNQYAWATVQFRKFPDATAPPTSATEEIRLYVGEYDGEANVLLREQILRSPVSTDPDIYTTSPLAFNVLSFNALAWDPTPNNQKWMTGWSVGAVPAGYPDLPAALNLTVTVYAGTRPLATLPPTEPVETVSLNTTVDVESVVAGNPDYDSLRPTIP